MLFNLFYYGAPFKDILTNSAVLNMIRSPDRDPPDSALQNRMRIELEFEKNTTGSDMDIQTALITAVKCLTRVFFRI